MKTSIAALHDFWQGKIVRVGVSIMLVDAPAAAHSGKVSSSCLKRESDIVNMSLLYAPIAAMPA